jgi:ELWxxDGT repeat protein
MDPNLSPFPSHRIVRLVGSGGMGAVYEAWDLRLERRVALKVLHPHLTLEPDHKHRLLREARLAARLEHPGIVRVYGIHEHEAGLALEMQFVVGTPLHQLLQTRALTVMQAADLLRQVLESLAACHAQAIIHCDLKPRNLLVTPDGQVLLTDFGISRALYSADDAVPSTSLSGPLWGTPQYCPPEAWEGEMPSPSWDLYALGVLVHEALAGSLPFQAHTPAVLMREKLDRPHVPIRRERPDISAELAELIDALKAGRPSARPATAEDALTRLRATPEFERDTVATQPFRHNVAATSCGESPTYSAALHSAALAHVLVAPEPPRRTWRRYAVALLGIAIAAAAIVAQRWAGNGPGTAMVVAEPAGTVGEIRDLFVMGDRAYFSYDDGMRGRELWYAPATGNAEMVTDINPGRGSSNPHRFLPRPTKGFLFAATTPDGGEEPWFCGLGASHSVWMLSDIIPGPMSSEPFPLAAWHQTFMFYATTLQHGTELWLSTSRAEQTGILKDLRPGDSGARMPPRVFADSSGAYVMQEGEHTWQLFRYDYANGTIRAVADVVEQFGEMYVVGDTLYFGMPDAEHGFELWVHQSGVDGAHVFADLWPGPESSYPEQLYAWKDALYFSARSESYGRELWKSDGTPEGTTRLIDIAHGSYDSSPYGFVPMGDLLFFRATESEHGQELWVTDGTAAGTRMVFDLRPGPESSSPYNIAVVGQFLFFSANDYAHGEELWVLDPARMEKPPRMVDDLWPGPESAEPHDLAATGPSSGFFVIKTANGDALMRLRIVDDDVQLEACPGLLLPS